MYDRTARLAKHLDRRRVRELGADARLTLLKTNGRDKAFDTLLTVPESWGLVGSVLEGATFKVARKDAEFDAAVRDASHAVVTGSTNKVLNNRLFAFDRNDRTPAAAGNAWSLRASGTGKRFSPV